MSRSFFIHIASLILYYSGLIKILRFWGRRYAKILMYHSISENENDFVRGTKVWLPPELFERHLKYILKKYRVISLQKLVQGLKNGEIPPRSVVITLDDGFADNYHVAHPYLKQFEIPATIFLVTDCINNKNPIWIQELYYLVNNIGIDPIFDLLIEEEKDFKNFMTLKDDQANRRRQQIVEEFIAYSIPKDKRAEILLKLYRKLSISKEKVISQNKIFLSWDQIIELRNDGIAFGNHGASHTPFSAMAIDEQNEEITQSKAIIERHLGSGFMPFAYPYGMARDFTSATKKIVEETGHSCLLTSMATMNSKDTSPYALGRINIDNIPVYRLAFEMEKTVLKKLLKRKFASSLSAGD